jgi:prophage antirepressor-like protein
MSAKTKEKNHNINILWENDKPIFRASDIGNVLESTLWKFDDDEKVARKWGSLGGPQETIFLTEAGMYRLIMNSRKPKAEPFQERVTQVLITIRETGKYELDFKVKESEARKTTIFFCMIFVKNPDFFNIWTLSIKISHYINKYIHYFSLDNANEIQVCNNLIKPYKFDCMAIYLCNNSWSNSIYIN